MSEIIIIGAGLSGTLLTLNLFKQHTTSPLKIILVDRNNKNNLGPAYSTEEDYLLNVPVELMGAFSNQPDHFLNWALSKNINTATGDYLPRKLYRKYIFEMFNEAYENKDSNISFERIETEAVDVVIKNKIEVHLKNGNIRSADKVVLALGNAPPRFPLLKNNLFLNDKRYMNNPWSPDVLRDIKKDDTVFLIGTGQTTVDIATGLYKRNHQGEMICISRRGVFPLSQKKVEPYPSFFDELKEIKDFTEVFSIVRKHIHIAEEKGLDPRSVIDSLRPHTKTIWMNLPADEKKRFLRHAFRYWEIIRSRIPPASDGIINSLKSSGQMKVITGKLSDIIPSKDKMEIKYTERSSENNKSVNADIVINCIGPCQDYEQIDQPLIKNLINKKLIQCDPVHLGINALPEGNVIQENGEPSDILFTIGLPLKGIVWESLAAPEIRLEAEILSEILTRDL